jgi:hypothetical protein
MDVLEVWVGYAHIGILVNVTLGIMEFACCLEAGIAKKDIMNAVRMVGIVLAICIVMYAIINTDARALDVFQVIQIHGQNASQTVIALADGIALLALLIVQDLIQIADANLAKIVLLKIIVTGQLIMNTIV